MGTLYPYIRLAGMASSSDEDWENAWLARPGIGFSLFPFSSNVDMVIVKKTSD